MSSPPRALPVTVCRAGNRWDKWLEVLGIANSGWHHTQRAVDGGILRGEQSVAMAVACGPGSGPGGLVEDDTGYVNVRLTIAIPLAPHGTGVRTGSRLR